MQRLIAPASIHAAFAASVFAALAPATCVEAAPMDGSWGVAYACDDAAETGPEVCAEGVQDFFDIQLTSRGERLCGFHIATAHQGNRVDEWSGDAPSIVGALKGDQALVKFHSSWGASGRAQIRVDGDKLTWEVVSRGKGESWIPEHAVLSRRTVPITPNPPTCSP